MFAGRCSVCHETLNLEFTGTEEEKENITPFSSGNEKYFKVDIHPVLKNYKYDFSKDCEGSGETPEKYLGSNYGPI